MVLDKIKQMMSEQLNIDPGKINMQTNFIEDLRIDSLDVVELLMSAEDEFGMEFENEVVLNFTNVGDIVDYIEKATKK